MQLLPIAAAGIVLGDSTGEMHVFATSSQETRLLEVFQIQADSGPCLCAYQTGEPVFVDDLDGDPQRWPEFTKRATEYGFRSMSALPLQLRGERLGALNPFRAEVGAMSPSDLAVGQALADVATIGILHQQHITESELVNRQLQSALSSRVVIEQAKGMLAERGVIDTELAFQLLRGHARKNQQRLADLARAVVAGEDTSAILNGAAKSLR
jgi:hypothetical protein